MQVTTPKRIGNKTNLEETQDFVMQIASSLSKCACDHCLEIYKDAKRNHLTLKNVAVGGSEPLSQGTNQRMADVTAPGLEEVLSNEYIERDR